MGPEVPEEKVLPPLKTENAKRMEEIRVGNDTPHMNLSCAECGIVKDSFEEVENHLKVEHLNWLPFQCLFCEARRASDALMREHLHSSHGNHNNVFIYIDDIAAKRRLQVQLGRSIRKSIARYAALPSPTIPEEHSTENDESPSHSPPRLEKQQVSVENLLEELTNGTEEVATAAVSMENETEDEFLERNLNPLEILNDVAALFSSGNHMTETANPTPKTISNEDNIGGEAEANEVPTTLKKKKRVVGKCKSCDKEVTAAGRQMHMFFHLAKDQKLYRFRCSFEGCSMEHYRKDQMEHHQRKIHGGFDISLMEDRFLELLPLCQTLSMDLLGSSNGIGVQHQENQTKTIETKTIKAETNEEKNTEDHLTCTICQRALLAKTRGLHIMWHLAKDKGINRYACKCCEYTHDRWQSVQTHALKKHGQKDVVVDNIKKLEGDIYQMSKECFGFGSVIEGRRKSSVIMNELNAMSGEKEGGKRQRKSAAPNEMNWKKVKMEELDEEEGGFAVEDATD